MKPASGLLAVLAFLSTCGPEDRGASTPPNIVLIMTDDAGYADFGFQDNSSYETPRIGSIAQHGITFRAGYVSASVCSPSRAGLVTGRYQQRFGHEYNLPGMPDDRLTEEDRGLPLTETTIADRLRALGYRTGVVGKWHLGLADRFHPTERGFDEFFGMRAGSSPYRAGTARAIECSYKEIDYRTLPYLTDAFGDEAAAFIDRNSEQPFFLYLSFNAPHTPMHARPDLLEAARSEYETEERATNAAMTESIDQNVGKVLDKLEELGLTENTIVFFTNDNGGAMPYNASLNAPLRGTKGTVLEGGNRVPFAVQWPARYPAGAVVDAPISTLDVLPTAVVAAGGSVADDELDGVDLTPFLVGETETLPHQRLFWKLNWGAAVRDGDWKLVRTPADEYMLFNLREDISESQDLFESETGKAAELQSLLLAWEAELPEPIWVSAPRWRAHSLERYDQETVDGYRRR